ncbi:hypothetical protein SEPCBS119000_000477 [Sporothrix epigloea]|uniref:Store-operated calcium entry-associated regulatory factor n=1 Tax=Sporothrix epigloea TaxID=1892477 RepID=A0ABP0D5C7_9PEZI
MHLHVQAVVLGTLAGLALLPSQTAAAASKNNKNAILLSKVQSLTLHAGKKTTHRRVAAVPQLTCKANPQSICQLYTVDTMRCTNQGTGYDEEDVQWSCTASLPPELKLGSTEVVCEGYSSAQDPYVLKGSCAVEYKLLLTDFGEQRYPDLANESRSLAKGAGLFAWAFWAVFGAVVLWILYSAFWGARDADGNPRRNWPGGGFWGGGGGGGGGDDPGFGPGNDPPPPYPGHKLWDDVQPQQPQQPQQQGWRPGFWTGAAAGAAAAHLAANRNNNRNNSRGSNNNNYGYGGDGGRSGSSSASSSSSSSVSSARRQNTGFGGTQRR